jgi:hypothetical protein
MKLKPCPFCNGKPKITFCEEECCGAKPRWVRCKCGFFLFATCDTEEEAIKIWNTRYEVKDVDDE